MQLIRHRCDQIMEGKKFPSLMIFPEGTTTNGKYLISFKKGAFMNMFPIKIFCIKYDVRNFNPALDTIDSLYHLILCLC